MQVANPNRAQFTKCAGYAIPYTTTIRVVNLTYAKHAVYLSTSFHVSLGTGRGMPFTAT